MIVRLNSLLFTIFFITMHAWAQSGSNAQNTLLPEINPQDIEIRSEFKAKFSGLRRQPILGFDPKPRVFQIDPNRIPFMESRNDAVASVAITKLDRPESPKKSILQNPLRKHIYARAGFGSYITPEIEGYFFQDLSRKSTISGNLDYISSDDHLNNQTTSFRFFGGNVQFNTKINRHTYFKTNLGGIFDSNHLFDLAPFYQDIIGSTAEKSYVGYNAGFSINRMKNAHKGALIDVQFNSYNSDLKAGDSVLAGTSDEWYVKGLVRKYWPGNVLHESYSISSSFKMGNYNNSIDSSENIIQAGVNSEYKRLINFNIHITANAGLSYLSDGTSKKVYFVPNLLVTYTTNKTLMLKAGFSGTPHIQSLKEHYQRNRFLNNETVLQHSYKLKVFAEATLKSMKGSQFYSGISFSTTKNNALYHRKIEAPLTMAYKLFYEINYDKTTELEVYGGYTKFINPEKIWVHLRLYARKPKLDNGDNIPFEKKLGAHTNINYKPVRKFLLSGWIDFVGIRDVPSVNEELSAFTLVNLKANYEITSNFGVYAKALNILGQKYELWDGYQERPFQIFGGLILKF